MIDTACYSRIDTACGVIQFAIQLKSFATETQSSQRFSILNSQFSILSFDSVMNPVKIINLSKSFPSDSRRLISPDSRWAIPPDGCRAGKNNTVFCGVSHSIKSGCIFGLTGKNGSGKTTLLKIISGLILPDDGTAEIFGYDIVRNAINAKRFIGFVPSDERSFYFRLTGRQNLEFFGNLYNVSVNDLTARINYFLSFFKLSEIADVRYANYSSGTKQKLQIIRALLHNPPILIIDELTKSLDSETSSDIFNFIKNITKQENKTVIVVSHNTEELKFSCDEIIRLENGKLI